MKVIKIIIMAMAICVGTVFAKETIVKNPEIDFVDSPETNTIQLGGDVVFRLDLDLYGVGKPFVFLTYKALVGRMGYSWACYRPIDGGYQRITPPEGTIGISFRPDGWYSGGKIPGYYDKGGLYVVYPGKGGGELVRYDIRDGAATVHHLRTLGWGNPDDIKLVEAVLGHKLDDPKFAGSICQVLSASAIRAGAASH